MLRVWCGRAREQPTVSRWYGPCAAGPYLNEMSWLHERDERARCCQMQRMMNLHAKGTFHVVRRRRAVISAFAALGAVVMLTACGGATPTAPSQQTIQAAATQAISTGATAVSAGASAA